MLQAYTAPSAERNPQNEESPLMLDRNAFHKARELGVGPLLLYTTLVDLAGSRDRCFASQAEITEITGIPERSVRRYTDLLVENNLIHVPNRGNSRGFRTIYQILRQPATLTQRVSSTPATLIRTVSTKETSDVAPTPATLTQDDSSTPATLIHLDSWFQPLGTSSAPATLTQDDSDSQGTLYRVNITRDSSPKDKRDRVSELLDLREVRVAISRAGFNENLARRILTDLVQDKWQQSPPPPEKRGQRAAAWISTVAKSDLPASLRREDPRRYAGVIPY